MPAAFSKYISAFCEPSISTAKNMSAYSVLLWQVHQLLQWMVLWMVVWLRPLCHRSIQNVLAISSSNSHSTSKHCHRSKTNHMTTCLLQAACSLQRNPVDPFFTPGGDPWQRSQASVAPTAAAEQPRSAAPCYRDICGGSFPCTNGCLLRSELPNGSNGLSEGSSPAKKVASGAQPPAYRQHRQQHVRPLWPPLP